MASGRGVERGWKVDGWGLGIVNDWLLGRECWG